MKSPSRSRSALWLALAIAATALPANAQVSPGMDSYGPDHAAGAYAGPDGDPVYDYARVLSVRPVIEDGYRSTPASARRCYERQDTYAGDGRDGDRGYGYGDDAYRGGGYREDGYRDDRYGRGGPRAGTETGRTVATVLGGIVGAAIGSQVGGGSARYATAAVGSMVGGIAGQKVYENGVRSRAARGGTVTVCDPLPDDRYAAGDGTGGGAVGAYDVTYEYAGREYTARTRYHPGDRIRVRVDVRPE